VWSKRKKPVTKNPDVGETVLPLVGGGDAVTQNKTYKESAALEVDQGSQIGVSRGVIGIA